MATQAERLDALETELGEIKASLSAGGAGAELAEGYDPRGELLKAFRQIEAIANHINVKLPA